MYTYIKRDIIGNYYESEVLINTLPGYEESVGNTWQDYLDGKFVKLTTAMLAYRSDFPDATVEEVFKKKSLQPEPTPEPVPERTLSDARSELYNNIVNYDVSSNVNLFYYNEQEMWLDKETRVGLKLRLEAERALGRTDTTLWYETTCINLSIDDAMMLLYALEVYASQCYDCTQSHLAVIENLSTVEECDGYDYTVGYPEKLHF